MMRSLYLCLVLTICYGSGNQDVMPRLLGTFKIDHPAYIEVFNKTEKSDKYSENFYMIITTFNPLGLLSHDTVYSIDAPGKYLDEVNDESWQNITKRLGKTSTSYWPNYPVRLPSEVANFDGILVTSGFIPPGKQTGKLEVYNLDQDTGPWDVSELSHEAKTWSYHWVHWIDINNDGLLDILTARFHVPFLIGETEKQVLWFKNPGHLTPNNAHNEWRNWEYRILIEDGPDTTFELRDYTLEETNYKVLMSAELFNSRLTLYFVKDDKPNPWMDPDAISMIQIDEFPNGLPYQATFLDINADGKEEIIVSNYDTEAEVGYLIAYILNDSGNWKDPVNWQKVVLMDSFHANKDFFNKKTMSPGKQRTFYPKTTMGPPQKPLISLSGDDDGNHYILTPKSENKDDFRYDIHTLIETGDTTCGTQAIEDLDGDGYVEIVSSGFSIGKVFIHTFAPK